MRFGVHVLVSVRELTDWARSTGVRLPFPLVVKINDDLSDATGSAVPAALGAVLDRLRAVLYAVRIPSDGREQRIVGLDSVDGESMLVQLDGMQARISSVGRGALVTAVADEVVTCLPRWTNAGRSGIDLGREVEVPLRALAVVDEAIAQGAADVDVPGLLADVGIPSEVVRSWIEGPRPSATGALGALAADPGGHMTQATSLRHATRSVTWREYRSGGLLAVELPRRPRREPMVRLGPVTERALTRAALDQFGLAVRQLPVGSASSVDGVLR